MYGCETLTWHESAKSRVRVEEMDMLRIVCTIQETGTEIYTDIYEGCGVSKLHDQ